MQSGSGQCATPCHHDVASFTGQEVVDGYVAKVACLVAKNVPDADHELAGGGEAIIDDREVDVDIIALVYGL
ncbi:hypothetical protein DSECCO2_654860 [anaerobic digester metagenome]